MIALLLAAAVAAPEPVVEVWRYGGNQSCATWLSSPSQRNAGEHWIGGMWSGMNLMNVRTHMVGVGVDSAGIVAEIEVVCRAEPSLSLWDATVRVYVRLQRQGR